MRVIYFIFAVLILALPLGACAETFNCDLNLALIEDSDSSELKHLSFNSEVNSSSPARATTGAMVTTSCFGTFTEGFNSDHSILEFTTIGDLIEGTFIDQSITIAQYHYRLSLAFSQIKKDPTNPEQINFIAEGNLIPLDNEYFIHQIAKGECHLNK